MGLRSGFVAIALSTLAIGGCSHGTVNELPAAPSAPTPILRTLTITPVGGTAILIGTTTPITSEGPLAAGVLGAFAQYSDGSASYVKATWTTSDANVIAVDGASIVTKARGSATLTATVDGVKANETFTVEPGVDGSWAGTYVVDTCEAGSSAIYEAVCGTAAAGRQGGVLPVGTTAPINFQITRTGATDLTATAALGELRGTLSGTDRGQNFLTLKGDVTSVNGTKVSLVYWDARVRTDAMEGFIGFEVRVPALPSWAMVTAHFADVTRR
jgi:hypothetical protein